MARVKLIAGSINLIQTIGTIFIILALLAPSYQRQGVVSPGGMEFEFSLSLFSVDCSSHCTPIWGNAPFINRKLTGWDVQDCRRLVSELDGLSIQKLTEFICGVSSELHSFGESACGSFARFFHACMGLICFLGLGLVTAITSNVFLFGFFLFKPTLQIRSLIFTMQLMTIALMCVGTLIYLLFGGNIHRDNLLRSFTPQHQPIESFGYSFSYGFGILIAAIIWNCTVPIWTQWAVRLNFCEDYESTVGLREEESKQLLTDIKNELAVSEYYNRVYGPTIPQYSLKVPDYYSYGKPRI